MVRASRACWRLATPATVGTTNGPPPRRVAEWGAVSCRGAATPGREGQGWSLVMTLTVPLANRMQSSVTPALSRRNMRALPAAGVPGCVEVVISGWEGPRAEWATVVVWTDSPGA